MYVCMYVNGMGTEATIADVLLIHEQPSACNEVSCLAISRDSHLVSGNTCPNDKNRVSASVLQLKRTCEAVSVSREHLKMGSFTLLSLKRFPLK